jgi:hypothetical protein
MEVSQSAVFIMVPANEWESLKKTQQLILSEIELLRKQKGSSKELVQEYITPEQFMKLTNMGRWKFDQLVSTSSIKSFKKKRKILIPVTEVKRYVENPDVL